MSEENNFEEENENNEIKKVYFYKITHKNKKLRYTYIGRTFDFNRRKKDHEKNIYIKHKQYVIPKNRYVPIFESECIQSNKGEYAYNCLLRCGINYKGDKKFIENLNNLIEYIKNNNLPIYWKLFFY